MTTDGKRDVRSVVLAMALAATVILAALGWGVAFNQRREFMECYEMYKTLSEAADEHMERH